MTAAPPAPLVVNPFPGPKPYRSDQAGVFFGREAQVDELTSLVLSTSAVLLHAPSGYGKSSLVEAGLRPSLTELGVSVLPTVRLGRAQAVAYDARRRPQDNPFVRVVQETVDPGGTPATLPDVLRGDALRVLVVDQFEELFLEPALWQERGAFLEQLKHALEADRRLRVVLAVRSDYLADLLPYESALPGRLLLRYGLSSLDEPTARRVIADACRDTGVPLTDQDLDGLLDHLLDIEPVHPSGHSVRGQSVNLVQLQILCRRLWSERAETGAGSALVRRTPDLAASMRLFVDDAVQEAVRELRLDEGVLRRWLEGQLLTPNGRRAVLPLDDEAGGLPRAAVACLERARLVQVEQRNRTQWVELSHDSMVSALRESNRRWDERYGRRYRRRIALAALSAVAALAAFPLLPAPQERIVREAGTTFPGAPPIAELSTSAQGQSFLLTGTVRPAGWLAGSDANGAAGVVGLPLAIGADGEELLQGPLAGTALRVVETREGSTRRTVEEVQTDDEGLADVFLTGPVVPGARYEVLAAELVVDFDLVFETLHAVDLRTRSRLPYTADVGERTALRLPAGALVRLAGREPPQVTGGRTLRQGDDDVVVEVGPTGVLLVESWAEQPLEVAGVTVSSPLAPGPASTVAVYGTTVAPLTGLRGRLPALVTTDCDRPVEVEVADSESSSAMAVPGRADTARTVLVGPVPADERLVLTAPDGGPARCVVAVAPVPEVEVPDRTALTVPVTGPVTAVPLAVDEDRVLLLPVPEDQSATLHCDDGQVLSAEAGERLLAYLEPGRACTLVIESWALYADPEETVRPAPDVPALDGSLLPPGALLGGGS